MTEQLPENGATPHPQFESFKQRKLRNAEIRRAYESAGMRYRPKRRWSVYFDFNDWWVGYYRGPNHHYVCLLPTVVVRWPRHITPPEAGAPDGTRE